MNSPCQRQHEFARTVNSHHRQQSSNQSTQFKPGRHCTMIFPDQQGIMLLADNPPSDRTKVFFSFHFPLLPNTPTHLKIDSRCFLTIALPTVADPKPALLFQLKELGSAANIHLFNITRIPSWPSPRVIRENRLAGVTNPFF